MGRKKYLAEIKVFCNEKYSVGYRSEMNFRFELDVPQNLELPEIRVYVYLKLILRS